MKPLYIVLMAIFLFPSLSKAARHPAHTTVVAHPSGCPKRLFCGCGAAKFVFGTPRRDLWAAKAWFRFPKSTPGYGKVAVSKGHVFVILRDLGNNKVLAYDANSGGGKTQIHTRSLKGYSVRDPGSTRLAMFF